MVDFCSTECIKMIHKRFLLYIRQKGPLIFLYFRFFFNIFFIADVFWDERAGVGVGVWVLNVRTCVGVQILKKRFAK